MTTKSAFIAALGGDKIRLSGEKTFVRSSGNILTATAHGLESGAGPFKVMTTNADAPAGLVAAIPSGGTLTGTAVIATDVAVIAGKTYTVLAAPSADGDVDLGLADAETMANLAQAVTQRQNAGASTYAAPTAPNPTVEAEVTSMGALGVAAVLTVSARTLDAVLGNAITISSVDSTIVASGATLAGGVSGTDYFIIKLTDDTFSVATSKAAAEAGTAVAIADAGTGIHKLVRTVDTLAEALEEVVVEHLTFPGNRARRPVFNIEKFWEQAIAFVS